MGRDGRWKIWDCRGAGIWCASHHQLDRCFPEIHARKIKHQKKVEPLLNGCSYCFLSQRLHPCCSPHRVVWVMASSLVALPQCSATMGCLEQQMSSTSGLLLEKPWYIHVPVDWISTFGWHQHTHDVHVCLKLLTESWNAAAIYTCMYEASLSFLVLSLTVECIELRLLHYQTTYQWSVNSRDSIIHAASENPSVNIC